jgi:hypothetical protein
VKYTSVDAFTVALREAAADLLTGLPTEHVIYAQDELSAKGDKAQPERPFMLVAVPQAQPPLQVAGGRYLRNERLARETTRLAIYVESRLKVQNTGARKSTFGRKAEHNDACKWLRNFITTNNSITIPADMQAEIGDQPLGFAPDEPFDGLPAQDEHGFRHVYFVAIEDLEVLCPVQ